MKSDVSFHFLAQLDDMLRERSLFRPARESYGSSHAPRDRRSHLIDITVYVLGKRLQMRWNYSKNVHKAASIEQFAEGFVKVLRNLTGRSADAEFPSCVPSDFPLANLNQASLDKIIARHKSVEHS